MSSEQDTHSVSLLVRPLPGPPLDVLERHHGGLLQLLEAFWVGEVLGEEAVVRAADHPHTVIRVPGILGQRNLRDCTRKT